MALYRVKVRETRIYDVTYFVEADSAESASEKANAGETEREEGATLQEVCDRGLRDEPVLADASEQEPKDVWGEHPYYSRAEWNREAGDNNTNLGYWDWVEAQKEMNSFDGSHCRKCGHPCFLVTPSGVNHHGLDGEIDHDQDADHVALPE